MARIIDAFTQFFDNSGNPLVNGKLRFLESGTSNTDKTTFKDAAMTAGLENTNPVILDGAGRLAFSVFGSGVYNVILFTSDDVQIQQFDPVGASFTAGQFISWSPSQTYDIGDIVRGSDGEYYQSFINSNTNNNPTLSSAEWDLITIVKSYIANASGTADVITADFTPVIHSLVNNTRVLITASAANSSTTPTFAPNGLTAKIIVKNGNQALIDGDISGSGFQADMVYRSGIDKWELLNPSNVSTTTTGASLMPVGTTAQRPANAEGLFRFNSTIGQPEFSNATDWKVYQEVTPEVITEGQDWDGVSYTDPDAVGANPTAKIYPDGTVIGSTDNGSYTKYPNGDFVGRFSFSAKSTNDVLTYPVVFISNPVVQITPRGASDLIFSAQSESTTGVTLRVQNAAAGFVSGDGSYTATGRWKA